MAKNHLSPHDRFIRSLMSHPKVMEEFFTIHLPSHIRDIVNLSSLKLQKESFVNDKLRLQIADLLYAADIQGEEGYIYLLIEHASSADRLLPLRMLKYTIAVMEHHLQKEKTKKLPFVYPIVMYTGKNPYPYSMDIFDLFKDQKELARDTLFAPYHLLDLTQVSDEEFAQSLWFGTMAQIAKHVHDADILPFLRKITHSLKVLDERGEVNYIYTVMSYIIEAAEISDKDDFIQQVKSLESANEDNIMTLAEQWKQEGFKKGIQTGIEKGREEGIQTGIERGKAQGVYQASHTIALNFLKLGINKETIAQATGLSLEEIVILEKQVR